MTGVQTCALPICSSKPAPPEEEVLEISSSGDEDFLVAPSRQVAEGEEDSDEEAVAGRCNPHSKAFHDRAAKSPVGTPLKRKAETAPEGPGSGAASSRSWRSSTTMWVDSRAKSSG